MGNLDDHPLHTHDYLLPLKMIRVGEKTKVRARGAGLIGIVWSRPRNCITERDRMMLKVKMRMGVKATKGYCEGQW